MMNCEQFGRSSCKKVQLDCIAMSAAKVQHTNDMQKHVSGSWKERSVNELGSRKIYTKVGGRKNNLFCQFIFVSIGKGGTFLESEAEVCKVLSLYIYFDQCRDPCHPPFATSSVPMRCIQQEPKEASNSSKTSSLRMQQCFFFPNTFCLGEDDFIIYFEIFAVRTNE